MLVHGVWKGDCGKLRVNGCGTYASRLERCCKEVNSVRWSGRHLQKLLPCSLLGKTRQKSMARGSGLESRDERLVASPQMLLQMPRERDAALPSRGQPVVERSPSRERFYESVPSTSPIRPIVCPVPSESSV